MLRCYYAHPMSLYNTPQEQRDIILLESLGFEVLNPNRAEYIGFDLDEFCDLANSCDVLAFRALADGSITSGVYEELREHPRVFELPSALSRRRLTVEQTLAALAESGQR